MGLKLYSPTEVSEILSVSLWTIYRWISQGKMDCYKLGGNKLGRSRISQEQIAKFLEKNFSERKK